MAGTEQLTKSAAERTDPYNPVAAAANATHAGRAKSFLTFSAAVRGLGLLVSGTTDRFTGECEEMPALGRVEFRNGDVNLGRLHEQFHVAQPQSLARRQRGLFDWLTVNEGSIGRGAVTHPHSVIRQYQFAVGGGNCGVLNWEIVVRAAPQSVDAQVEFYHLSPHLGSFND